MSAERNRNNIRMTDLQNSLLLSWRRAIEIGLATKRKLGFFKELLPDDPVKADMLDTYNGMVIVWLTNSMTDSIMKSMMFLNSALNIWIQLERRFSLSNGSRKYQINKEIYPLKQNHSLVTDYYATLSKVNVQPAALYSRNEDQRCSQCGNKCHTREKCWAVIGYPSWHPRHKQCPQQKGVRPPNMRNKGRVTNEGRTAANARVETTTCNLCRKLSHKHTHWHSSNLSN
ncbi:hypothetical protein Cgig2_022640 [Carnegiea gigantea]|uniref:Uncharacterized protein n=1 Tax=Carnegiea gigantea TaxID=171969 RepID=A0A9Q1GJG4_9CARY|nr:hypothetical protein Cgig2_022640 [Carnegiea gigantea]